MNENLNWFKIFENKTLSRIIFEIIVYRNKVKNKNTNEEDLIFILTSNFIKIKNVSLDLCNGIDIKDINNSLKELENKGYIKIEQIEKFILDNAYLAMGHSENINIYLLTNKADKFINEKYKIIRRTNSNDSSNKNNS
jgi:hypothetical protein